jgi:hypothetical protein
MPATRMRAGRPIRGPGVENDPWAVTGPLPCPLWEASRVAATGTSGLQGRSSGLKSLVRVTLLVAPILVSLGFFLSVLSPKAERPNRLINLIYLAAVLLAVGVVTLGIGLFQA